MAHPAGNRIRTFPGSLSTAGSSWSFTAQASPPGLLAYRELDDAVGLTALAGGMLSGGRRGKNTRHTCSLGCCLNRCSVVLPDVRT